MHHLATTPHYGQLKLNYDGHMVGIFTIHHQLCGIPPEVIVFTTQTSMIHHVTHRTLLRRLYYEKPVLPGLNCSDNALFRAMPTPSMIARIRPPVCGWITKYSE